MKAYKTSSYVVHMLYNFVWEPLGYDHVIDIWTGTRKKSKDIRKAISVL